MAIRYYDADRISVRFDPASLAILDRINYVANLLETGAAAGNVEPQQGPSPASLPPHAPPEATATNASQIHEDDDLSLLDDPEFTAATFSCENILQWPIFRVVAPDVKSFVFELGGDEDLVDPARSAEPRRLGRGVQEDDFIPLSKKFLAFAHIKNPILDLSDFRAHVKEASENGPRWDGQSCLVVRYLPPSQNISCLRAFQLIACALGCLSSPFQRDSTVNGTPDSSRSMSATSVDQATASSYYLAAKKRLGLLEPSVLQVQCLFLCGVFEMYSLRPLRAWSYFNQASVSFRNFVWMRTQRKAGEVPERQRLEQRLYWSCMKSEL